MRYLLVSLFSCLSICMLSQESAPAEKRNSIGAGFGFIPVHHDEVMIPAADVSYGYQLDDIWSVGFGAGIHFTKIPYYVVVGRVNAGIFRNLSLGLCAGGSFLEGTVSPVLGTDLGYDFSLGDFSLGPVLEASYHNQHVHIMLGIHFSFGF